MQSGNYARFLSFALMVLCAALLAETWAQTAEEKKPPETPTPAPASATDKTEAAPASTATPAPPPNPAVREGEVIGRDVYVRSGDSLNHYTICKLSAGDKVTIVGERGDWFEILPPEGTFSLISGEYVDTTDNQVGIVNAENVRVRAGSLLNDNKYTVQTLLKKGAQVTILGRNPDGFLRIKPPPGATLWINRNYVAVTGEEPRNPSDPAAVTTKADPSDSPRTTPPTDATSTLAARKVESPPASAAVSHWRKLLEEADALARSESAKPVAERNLEPVLAKFQPIASQTEDQYASQFAQRRIEQIESMKFLSDAITKVRELDTMSEAKRREFLAARASIPEPTVPIPTGIEVQGELRVSAIYPPDSPNPRYRLIDPRIGPGRTIGYVEIPSSLNININDYLGHRVIVRASEMRPQKGSVEPVPNYIAREIERID